MQAPIFKKVSDKNKLHFGGTVDPKTMNLSFKGDNKKPMTFTDKTKKNEPSRNYNESYDRRKDILEEHGFCLKSLRTSIEFTKLGLPQSPVFAYLILDKCDKRLKKLIEDIKGQKEYEDINQLLCQ